jgi:hypothetical protein
LVRSLTGVSRVAGAGHGDHFAPCSPHAGEEEEEKLTQKMESRSA